MAKIYGFALTIALSVPATTFSQQPTGTTLPKGYYVVVAAYFSYQEGFAQHYSKKLNIGGLHSNYGLEPRRKLFFVYLDQYSDFKESVQQMLKVRNEGTFAQAWVRTIREVDEREGPLNAKKEDPVQRASPVAAQASMTTAAQNTKQEGPKAEEERKSVEPIATEKIEPTKPKPPRVPKTLSNTQVFLSLYNSTNNQAIDGELEVVDTERSKLITKVKSNTYLSLPDPGTKSGQLSLISSEFGFRKEQHEINYLYTESDTIKPYVALVENHFMINFGLSRIHKGDIATLYNVYFYNDAAIMLPESKYQLNSLLQLFTENPKLKAILHGHTNGNGRGRIIYMGPAKDFFNITKDVVQGSGSAKELSMARASVIREWLLRQGIADNRVAVKGWGGSRMIHDKNSVHARKNIRVDVEIIED
jgi:outer membrane protein OmpA-like peptidoglycan-associated protein